MLLACQTEETNFRTDEAPIARVGKSYLYPSDLSKLGYSAVDSLDVRNKLVNDWIIDQLMLQKAAEQLSVSSDIENKVNEYRNSLLLYEYRTALIQKNKVTVSATDIENYYNEHQSDFLLDQDMSHIRYIFLPENTLEVKSLIASLDEGNMPHFIDEICTSSPEICRLDNPAWLADEDIERMIELPKYLQVVNNQYKQFKTEHNGILVYEVLEQREQGDVKPLSMVEEIIEQIVLNNKKKQVLSEIENKIYINAKNNQSIEVYN